MPQRPKVKEDILTSELPSTLPLMALRSTMDEVLHIALMPVPDSALADAAPADGPAAHAADPPPPDADSPALD